MLLLPAGGGLMGKASALGSVVVGRREAFCSPLDTSGPGSLWTGPDAEIACCILVARKESVTDSQTLFAITLFSELLYI